MPSHSPAGVRASHQNKDMIVHRALFTHADLNSVMPSQKLAWCFREPAVTTSLLHVYFFPVSPQDKHVSQLLFEA